MGADKHYNPCLDFIKGLACLCVVFMHCEFPGEVGTIVQAASRFSVPFFFMVSGYFCFYSEKYDDAIILYVLFAFVLKSVYVLTRKEIWAFGVFNQPFIIVGQLWFLFALLYDYFAFGIIWKVDKIKWFYLISAVLIVVYICMAQGAHLCGIKVPNMYYRNWLIEGLPFFFAGHWIHANQEKIRVSDKMLFLNYSCLDFVVFGRTKDNGARLRGEHYDVSAGIRPVPLCSQVS